MFWAKSDQKSDFHGNRYPSLKWIKRCEHLSNFIFDWIIFILAGNVNNYKISDEFEIWPAQTTDCEGSCP